MPMAIEEIGTITAKGQTTVPEAVRRVLGIGSGDRIAFRIDDRGVTVHRVDDGDEDPAITAFLTFLAKDMETRSAVTALPTTLIARMQELTEGLTVDADAPIEGEVDL